MRTILLAVLWFPLIQAHVFASEMNAIPSCYNKKLGIDNNQVLDAEIFVLVDQTTPFDQSLKQSIADNLKGFIKPNNAFSIVEFSAYTQGHYAKVLVSGKLDNLIDSKMRDEISKPLLQKFDQCVAMQSKFATQKAGMALRAIFSVNSNEINKSDVISSLKEISMKVKSSSAKRKIVLIASDMLENSSLTSFYSNQSVRLINPDQEMKLAIESDLIGDFNGADIYVTGAGLLSSDTAKPKGIYRSPQIMQSLSLFWKKWFEKSNGKLVEFGQPALLNQIR